MLVTPEFRRCLSSIIVAGVVGLVMAEERSAAMCFARAHTLFRCYFFGLIPLLLSLMLRSVEVPFEVLNAAHLLGQPLLLHNAALLVVGV